MFFFEYNGHTTTEYGVAVTTRPNVPVATPRGEYVQVAGRNGSLLVTDDTFENIEIDVELNFVRAEKYWWNTQRILKNWITGSGTLKFSDDSDWFYKVKQAMITDTQRRTRMGNELVAHFICEPFQYHVSGQATMSLDEVKLNPYYEAHPVYAITGTGDFSLVVNSKEVSGTIDRPIVIDTDLLVAYDNDMKSVNNLLIGDYENLWLDSGENDLSITSGFTCLVKPNWRTL